MKALSLSDIQTISLDILTVIHDFCVSNHIKYSLMYGTLIGAIRHHGFIPWDDDIDIIMPRPDYDRFCISFSGHGLDIISEKNKDCFINYCRVFDTIKTRCSTLIPFAKNYKGGIWVDVFPIDGVSDDFTQFAREIGEMKKLWNKQIRYRQAMMPSKDFIRASFKGLGGVDKWKNIGTLEAVKVSHLGPTLLHRSNCVLRSFAKRIAYGSTSHWSQLTCLDDGVSNYQLTDDFETVSPMPFEGRLFNVLNGYDRVLRNIYGDYMQLPPENQRHGHQNIMYYWNDESR